MPQFISKDLPTITMLTSGFPYIDWYASHELWFKDTLGAK
jgi:hypothetical protein